MRDGWRRLLVAAAMIVLQFGVFEAALRYHGGSEAAPSFQRLFTTDETIGYRLQPGATTRFTTPEFSTSIVINPQGVRDDPVGPKTPGERRIAVLGDSIVLAVQVEAHETLCRRLEERLNQRAGGPRYRVINAGVQGYGPVEELLFFERVVAPLEPDLVVIVAFVANDAVEALDRRWKLDPDRRAERAVQAEAQQTLRRLVRRSMVAQVVRLRVNQAMSRFSPRPAPDRRILSYAEHPPDEILRGFTVAADLFDRIAQAARARGADAAMVLMPARFQLDRREYERVQAMVAPDGYSVEIDGASRRFAEALEPRSMPVFDLLPAFRAAPDPLKIFFRSTVHLTPEGHQVTAAALERFLRAEDLVP